MQKQLSQEKQELICPQCDGQGVLGSVWDYEDKRQCHVCLGKGKWAERNRPSWDHYFLSLLPAIKARSACFKRQVGALIISVDKNIIATGYNGQPRGVANCPGSTCNGIIYKSTPAGKCRTVHAEVNAIFHAGDRIEKADTIYITTEPCLDCALLIKQTPISRVIFLEKHKDSDGSEFLRDNEVDVCQLTLKNI